MDFWTPKNHFKIDLWMFSLGGAEKAPPASNRVKTKIIALYLTDLLQSDKPSQINKSILFHHSSSQPTGLNLSRYSSFHLLDPLKFFVFHVGMLGGFKSIS